MRSITGRPPQLGVQLQPRSLAAALAAPRRCRCSSSNTTSSSSSTSSSSNSSGDATTPPPPPPAAPAAAAAPPTATPAPPPAASVDWEARRKKRAVDDLADASKRLGYARSDIAAGAATLEQLLPGLQIDVERLRAADWATLCINVSQTANKIVLLKTLFPRADLTKVIQNSPGLLLLEPEVLQDNARQVKALLASAKDLDALVTALPALLDPHLAISIVVTVNKWYFGKRDPVEVLEADPDLVRRAQECDMPWEPVYTDADGRLMAPSLNYHEKRTDWQKYIDQTFYGQE